MINVEKYVLTEKIKNLKQKKKAIILAHYYQIPEIQDLADFIGDSLALSQKAYETDADIIVFSGVHFMAETAKILNPRKKVLLPDLEAGCSLADSCPYDKFKEFTEANPHHLVISYINCSAAVKTLSDVICTSGNAVEIVNSFPKDQKIIFAPDKNLGSYINGISGRNMLLWDGVCHVHDLLNSESIVKLKIENPDAELIAHPECKAAILELADFVGSTAAMLKYTVKSSSKRFIVATEGGILHQMKKDSPEKEFIVVPADSTCNCNDCPYMKRNTLQKIYDCLLNDTPEIIMSEELMNKARKPIIKMLDLSESLNLIKKNT